VLGMKMQLYEGEGETLVQEFDDDEYIIEIVGRSGWGIDKIGFKTNKNEPKFLGGEGGGPFTVKAPEGFHFTCFSAAANNDFLYSVGMQI